MMSASSIDLRWYAKKAARTGVAVGSWGAGALRSARAGEPRVLTYHRFGDDPHDPFCVDLATFRKQMETLAESGCAVSVADIEGYLYHGETLPAGAALVTIDDGYRSTYSHAMPVMRELGIPGVAYIPAGVMEAGGDVEPRMTWDEVGEIAAAGIAIGSHAWSHESLGAMSEAQVGRELERSRRLLERRVGTTVASFAYPFGTRSDYNDDTRRLLCDCGYRTAFTSQHGSLDPAVDPLELPRIKVEGGEPLWMFRLLVRGGLDAWSVVDRTLWRLQANRNPDAQAA